jgi:hypothetical protein
VPETKGKSPFYPGQPVPVDLFVGRAAQIGRILERGVAQVALGKPVSMFVEGEYGIGKSSIAGFTQWVGERDHGLFGIYAPLGSARTIDDVGGAVLEATVRSGALDPTRSETVRTWLGKYVGEQSLFGITLHAEALRKDAPSVGAGMLPFLGQVVERLKGTGVKGVFLVLDEINGIASRAEFAHFIKSLVDTNAMGRPPLPVLLMLCGVEECRREMIRLHPPIDRIFDVIEIAPMTMEEMKAFFTKAFESVGIRVEDDALDRMAHYSAGFPKVMHLVGDAAFWLDRDDVIDKGEAFTAVLFAADEVGKKYVDQQVYKALRSSDYRSILKKIGTVAMTGAFRKADIVAQLTPSEKSKFNNFLQKMKQLRVVRSGQDRGEYVFNMRMVALYIFLESIKNAIPSTPDS